MITQEDRTRDYEAAQRELRHWTTEVERLVRLGREVAHDLEVARAKFQMAVREHSKLKP